MRVGETDAAVRAGKPPGVFPGVRFFAFIIQRVYGDCAVTPFKRLFKRLDRAAFLNAARAEPVHHDFERPAGGCGGLLMNPGEALG